MEQNHSLAEPRSGVIMTGLGGALELLDDTGNPEPRICLVANCPLTAVTIMVGYGRETMKAWRYCADHGVEAFLYAEQRMPRRQ